MLKIKLISLIHGYVIFMANVYHYPDIILCVIIKIPNS